MISRRIFAALALLCALIAPAHAQKTKATLNAEIGVQFPDNTQGQITPLNLRNVTGDIVNSIMPTAPVVSGNLACFNGTTGLLQDCGSAPFASIVLIPPLPPSPTIRLALTLASTIYVNPSSVSTANCNGSTCQPGSLANTCLSIASPCLTLQQATNLALSWDNNGVAITVQLSDGTYTAGTIIDGYLVGGGRAQAGGPAVYPLIFNGNNSTPTNVIISTVGGPCFQADHYAYIMVTNMLTKCVYDFNALNYGQIYVNGGVTTDSVAVANSLHYYATFYGSIRVDGANFYKNTGGTGTPDALFQATHHGNVRFGVLPSATLTATSNVTFALATAYTLSQADITVTAGATFIPGAFTITGQCWRVEDSSIQWAGGSGVCNNAAGFPGTLAGTINGGFGDFYTTGAWCTPSVSVFTTGTNATYTTPSCRGQLARYIVIEGVGGGGGGAGSGTTPGAATIGGNTCWNTSSPACTTPIYQMGGGAFGSVSAGTSSAGGTVSGTGTCDDSQPGGASAGGANQSNQFGGSGGQSRYGGAGPGQFAGAGIAAATNSGSGGGGAGDATNINSGGGGGAGAWCQAQIVTPAASYFYTVPATAAGGTLGTGGSVGGVGAAGKLKATAYWNFLLKRDLNGDNDNTPAFINMAA